MNFLWKHFYCQKLCCTDNEHVIYRVTEGSVMISVANGSIPVAMLSHDSLVVPILGLSHQEFVQKV